MPGHLHLPLVKAQLRDGIQIGAQNSSQFDEGPYTGEVSAFHLTDYRVEYVLVGHSDRRFKLNQTQANINTKIKQAAASGLGIVYCFGETAKQYDDDETEEAITAQLKALVQPSVHVDWTKTVLVYEPLWAITKGVITSADQTQDACKHIRDWVKERAGVEAANQVRIVFGGPVTITNAQTFIKLPDIDGFLMGVTSTKPDFRPIFELLAAQVEKENW